MRMFGKLSCRHSSCERGLPLSIFDFKRKKYRTFLQDSETGEEIAEEYEKGRGPIVNIIQADTSIFP